MTLFKRLSETYDAAQQLDIQNKPMPLYHTQNNAHIKITLDGDGNFKRAETLGKKQVMLPATENSSNARTSGAAPHPLADQIQYVAKDYPNFGGVKASYFTEYSDLLQQWCDSPHAPKKVIIVKKYIDNGTVVADLIKHNVLCVDADDVLLTSWNKTNSQPKPEILKQVADQGKALVIWSVEEPNDPSTNTWEDQVIQTAWVAYVNDNIKLTELGLCHISGQITKLATSHPVALRHPADKAKLISGNDESGFTYRGRFTNKTETFGISREVSEKSHKALKWLIANQGFRNVDQVILAWVVDGSKTQSPTNDIWSQIPDNIYEIEADNINSTIDNTIDLGATYAKSLRNYMLGYNVDIKKTDKVIIAIFNSALADKGGLAVTYYKEFDNVEYIETITKWHTDFAWHQTHTKWLDGKSIGVWKGISTPSLNATIKTIHGKHVKDGVNKRTMAQLIKCIIEGSNIPHNLVEKAVRRVSNPMNYESNIKWAEDLNIACSLYKGYTTRTSITKEHTMSLDSTNTSRDYLFGRLLACADKLEYFSLQLTKSNRPTAATRLMKSFQLRPFTTWNRIETSLSHHQIRLSKSKYAGALVNIQKDITEITELFTNEDYLNDKTLSGEYLLGYHNQKAFKRHQKD